MATKLRHGPSTASEVQRSDHRPPSGAWLEAPLGWAIPRPIRANGKQTSEVSALLWGDVAESAAGDGVLVTVRRGKTNPAGEVRDVRFVKGDVAVALRTQRDASSAGPGDRVVPLSPQMVGLRFQASARAAGVEPVTAHSGRVGLASELTRRGASTTDVMLAGNWKTSRMVAHYSSGATAERGAVAQYL